MKPFTQNLLASFIGALIATVLVLLFGILWIGDDEGSNDSEQEKTDVIEQIYAYFDDHDISYEPIDSIATRFTFKGLTYVFCYDSVKSDNYLQIWTRFSLKEDGDDSVPDDARHAAFEKAWRIQEELVFVKISVLDDCIYFCVEQYIAPDMDMAGFMSCMLEVLDYSTDLYLVASYYPDKKSGGGKEYIGGHQ